MMDSGSVRNMQSSLIIICEIVHHVGFYYKNEQQVV